MVYTIYRNEETIDRALTVVFQNSTVKLGYHKFSEGTGRFSMVFVNKNNKIFKVELTEKDMAALIKNLDRGKPV